jgi:hypothetical protein
MEPLGPALVRLALDHHTAAVSFDDLLDLG